jgi:hypothetical protein
MDFCACTSKTEMVKKTLCDGALENGNEKCIRGECDKCGFKKIWSDGLKWDVIGLRGDLGHRPGRVPVYVQVGEGLLQQEVQSTSWSTSEWLAQALHLVRILFSDSILF